MHDGHDTNPTIVRRERINMRDPQQQATTEAGGTATIARLELQSFSTRTGSMRDDARHIIDEARATAEQMLAQARAACDAEIEEARRQGFEAGRQEGLAQADREAAGLLQTAVAIAENAAREREQLLEQAEGELVELAIAIANRMVNASLEADPSLVLDVCQGAMRKAFQRETLVVQAHPDDLEMLREAGPAMARELGGIHQLDFVEERRLQRGSVIVRTPVGEIDATFASKAGKITEALREVAGVRRAELRGGGGGATPPAGGAT